jgi:hypothetical protein
MDLEKLLFKGSITTLLLSETLRNTTDQDLFLISSGATFAYVMGFATYKLTRKIGSKYHTPSSRL